VRESIRVDLRTSAEREANDDLTPVAATAKPPSEWLGANGHEPNAVSFVNDAPRPL